MKTILILLLLAVFIGSIAGCVLLAFTTLATGQFGMFLGEVCCLGVAMLTVSTLERIASRR